MYKNDLLYAYNVNMNTKKRTPCKKTQKRRGKKQNNNNSSKKRRGGTKVGTKKKKSVAQSKKLAAKIDIVQKKGLPYRHDSFLRAFSKKDPLEIENMSPEEIEKIYVNWRKTDAEQRKAARAKKRADNSLQKIIKAETRKAARHTPNKKRDYPPLPPTHDERDYPPLPPTHDETTAALNAAIALQQEDDRIEAADMEKYGATDFYVSPQNTPLYVSKEPTGFTPFDRKPKMTENNYTSPKKSNDLFPPLPPPDEYDLPEYDLPEYDLPDYDLPDYDNSVL